MARESFTPRVIMLLDGVTTTASSDAYYGLPANRVFNLTITGVATVVMEVTFDGGGTWVTLSTLTASQLFSTSEPWPGIRGRVSAYSSGAVTLQMAV